MASFILRMSSEVLEKSVVSEL